MEKSKSETTVNPDLFFWGSQAYEYMVDRTQRSVLFWDVFRKRGNNYLTHIKEGQPAILIFEHEEIMDGRTFEEPVNYSLVRIKDRRREERKNATLPGEDRRQTRHGKAIGDDGLPARPIVVIDPRAGHGPGIGGSKLSSQIGVALEYGHPVYFISFFTEPEPGQTISRVHKAEVRFLEEVTKRHPDAPKPAVIGNCQAGWATALIGADRPDLTGPMVFNGSPLSYWGGVEGANPMRYKGGLTGGVWMTSLWSDLGSDKFDGANLVAGFEDLNPANTLWSKYYHLFSHIDTEEQRFLDFEKWWGGFFKMNAEEIHFIVNSLFVGNELEKGLLKLDDGRLIDLKKIKAPVLAFASEGDNITPPPQALNWIYKVYGTVDEIKRCDQVIIYMVHKKVGHLGIFVSSSVAKKEHNQILGSMGWLDYLAPGLYEMVIDDASKHSGSDDYQVRFEEREMEDILQLDDGMKDQEPFEAVNTLSRFNDSVYRTFISPWIRAAVNEQGSEVIRQLHPLRMQRYMISDNNPFCWPLKSMAKQVAAERKIVKEDNPFVQMEEIFSESLKSSLDFYRDMRDISQEMIFKSLYSSPWMNSLFGEKEQPADKEVRSDQEQVQEANREKARLRKEAEKGGFVEGSLRVMLAIAGEGKSLDLREFKVAEDIIQGSRRLSKITPAQLERLVEEQTKILNCVPRKALTSLTQLLETAEDRKKVYAIAERMAGADTNCAANEKNLLEVVRQILFDGDK
jgi:pimeloyl-ACP methyl ester carboxylesterase